MQNSANLQHDYSIEKKPDFTDYADIRVNISRNWIIKIMTYFGISKQQPKTSTINKHFQ